MQLVEIGNIEVFGERGPYLARRLREMCRVYDADNNTEIVKANQG